jgi:hypothetical protein
MKKTMALSIFLTLAALFAAAQFKRIAGAH